MDKNICLGLSWLLLPIGIVALAVDHDKMYRREKQTWVSTYVVECILIIFNSIDNDIIEYKYDPKYTELPWAIKCFCSIIGIAEGIDIDLQRDRFEIYSQQSVWQPLYLQHRAGGPQRLRCPSGLPAHRASPCPAASPDR